MTTPQEHAAEQEPPETGDAVPARTGRRRPSFAVVGQAAAVVGLVGGVVGLVFTFFPDLRPGTAAKPTAQLEVANVNGGAPLREYLIAEGIPRAGLSDAVLARRGVLATIHYTSSGLEGKTLPLVVSLTRRDTGDIVCRHTYLIEAGSGAELTYRTWSAFPATTSASGAYNLHATLFPPDGMPPALDAADEYDIRAATTTPGPPLPLDLC